MKEIIFDIGHEETEELLKQTEKRIENVYRQAYKELKKKSDDYMSQFLKTDAEKRKAMQAGEITKDEYRQWRQSHLLTGRRWVSMQESIAKDLNNSNQIAASIINGHLPDVYAININWATYQLEHDFKIDTSFTLYDRQTMERLLRDDPDLLPWQAKINTPEDIRYQKRHLSSAMMQGILQGETIPQISERLASSPCRMNARNAVTNARTMYTSAQNGGRIDGYKRAEGMGIHLKKQWLATLDGRTRHEHRQLDGQIVGTDESFEVDGYEIEFPGDPKAAAEMVYNCRCTMRSVLDALDKGGYAEYEKNGKLGDMSYEEWKNEHSEASENKRVIQTLKYSFIKADSIEQAQDFANQFCESKFMDRAFKGKIDYKGISIDNANAINQALTDVFNNVDVEKLSGIKTISSSSAAGKKAFKDGADAVMSYDPIQNGIYLNKDILKSDKIFNEYVKRSEDAWNTVMSNIDKLSGSQKELALTYKNAGRDLVDGKSVKGMFTHELGHHVQWTLLDTKTNNAIGLNMKEYAPKISGYANSNKSEYLAESFVAYMNGETALLDPEYVKYLKSKR